MSTESKLAVIIPSVMDCRMFFFGLKVTFCATLPQRATDLGLDDGAGGVNSVQMAMARFSEPSGSDPASIQEHQEYFAILNKEVSCVLVCSVQR